MAELKTKVNNTSVKKFLDTVKDERKRKDCRELSALMRSITGRNPKMWGTAIIGFGSYHYTYKSGQEGDWMLTGFPPRKQNVSIYIMPGFSGYGAIMKKLGKYKTGKSCLYVKNLDDIDRGVLRKLVERSVADMKLKYG